MEIVHTYGIDTTQPVTAPMVRDAIVACFYEAHKNDLEIDSNDQEVTQQMVIDLIKKAFTQNGDDFEKPTKQSLYKLVKSLREFSANFRDTATIEKHATEIQTLIDLISE